MKLAFILGTRPEIIKLSPVIREAERRKHKFIIIHTNQHYSARLDQVFFTELKLPRPNYNLNVSSESRHGAMVAKMLIGVEAALLQEKPDWAIVQGDTNTTLAAALAASKLEIKLAHVEAGLRSYDRSMPEELNRIVVDHLADLLLCPTPFGAKIARGEGIAQERIFVTGNTIVDAVRANLKLAGQVSLPTNLPRNYFLLTLHRPVNVDDRATLRKIVNTLEAVVDKFAFPFLFPAHPRTVKQLRKFKLNYNHDKIQVISPVSYLAMLQLERRAKLILTDSGGIQEEACILQVPCVTLRDNTERPETVIVGANLVAGTTRKGIISSIHKMLSIKRNWDNPFGDGRASNKIIAALTSLS